MNQTDEPSVTAGAKRPNLPLLVMISITIILLIVIVILLVKPKSSPSTTPKKNNIPTAPLQKTEYSLYYPAQLPQEYSLVGDSYSISGKVARLTYQYSQGNQLIITEQPNPPIIEEVKKIKDVKTAIGEGYIADLNGHNVGFIKTDTTLIILSSSAQITEDQLETVMLGFKKL